MSGPQPYAPGATGTLADVLEQGPDLRAVRPAGPDSFAPPPSSGELFSAYRTQGRAYRTDFDEIMLRDGYAPIVDALGLGNSQNPAAFFSRDVGHDPVVLRSDLLARQGNGFLGSMADRQTQEELIAAEIRAHRLKDPKFLPEVPDTVDGLHAWFRANEEKKRQGSGATIARGEGGLRQALIGLAGGGFESFHDPVNLLTLPIGGGGKTLVQIVARETLLNGVLEAAQLPVSAANLSELGEHMTAGGAAQDVISAGVFGGVLGGSLHVAGEHVPPALFKAMPETVQRRWADRMTVGGGRQAPLLKDVLGDMDNRELGAFARSTLGERIAPDEKAAADVLEREQELGEASPFMPGPAGDAAHNASLAASLQSIIDGADRSGAPIQANRGALLSTTSINPAARQVDYGAASVPHDIVDFFKAKGLDDAHAYGIAAGIMAESGGNHAAVNGSSGATGLGQWLGARLEGLKARYGRNPSRAEQLEYLWHELSGGDPGGKHVLAAKDAGSVLDAYVRKFMRPAAGAETLGDVERGMHALGRDGEIPEGGAAIGGDDDLVEAARRDAQAADEEALALSREDPDADLGADLGRAQGPTSADMPILKRELFASDADWAEAQVAFYRSQGLAGGPLERETASAGTGQPEAPQGAEIAPGESAGPFGPEFPEAAGDWQATLAALREAKSGVVPGALDHPDIGPIDLPYGIAGKGKSDGYGLAKLEAHHADVIAELPEILRSMKVESWTPNRVQLEGPGHKGGVSLDWQGSPTNAWLLTAFAKDAEHLPKDAPALPVDSRGRTPGAPEYRRGAPGGRNGSSGLGADGNIGASGPIDNPALKAFDVEGNGRAELADSLEHDYRAAAAEPDRAKRAYEIDGRVITLTELLDEFDRDREAAAALRSCAGLAGGGAP